MAKIHQPTLKNLSAGGLLMGGKPEELLRGAGEGDRLPPTGLSAEEKFARQFLVRQGYVNEAGRITEKGRVTLELGGWPPPAPEVRTVDPESETFLRAEISRREREAREREAERLEGDDGQGLEGDDGQGLEGDDGQESL